MKFRSKFEKKIGNQLKNDLTAGTPDVLDKILDGSQQSLLHASADYDDNDIGKKWSFMTKRRFFKAAAVILPAAVIIAGISLLFYNLPILQAKANTVYDSGGYLHDISYQKPNDAFIGSYNDFSMNILKHLYKDNEKNNIFISPASLYLALGMTYNGAQGQTALEFKNTMNIKDSSLDAFNQNCVGLQSLLTSSDRFKLANSIWLGNDYQKDISENFLERNRKCFGASVATLDFASTSAPEVINRWVKKNTDGRIDPGLKQFDTDTVMALINTVYFKAEWQQKFEKAASKDDIFKTPEGDKTVRFMHGAYSGYFENSIFQGIIIPYDDNQTSMMILLPKSDLNSMLAKLTSADLAKYVKDNLKSTASAQLSLPRVKFNYNDSVVSGLKEMGLKTAFDPDHADFSGMLSNKNKLYIEDIKHMSYLAVDEKGTEAAAATVVIMDGKTCPCPSKNIMNVNHPFLTAIVNNDTGAALFIGTVTDPSALK